MTENRLRNRRHIARISVLLLLYFYCIVRIDDVAESVKNGLFLSFTVMIPTLFPFLILSDLVLKALPEKIGKQNGLFSRLFRITDSGFYAFFLGSISGFPIGAKIVSALYRRGDLSHDEAERLLVFSNNTGPAFLFGVVGAALYGNIRVGIFLYIIQMLAAVLIGILLGIGKKASDVSDKFQSERKLSFTDAVENAVPAALRIAAYIAIFRVVVDIFAGTLKNAVMKSVIAAFLEVGNAVTSAAALFTAYPALSLSVAAFAVSFSGLSVYMQSLVFLKDTDLSRGKYLFYKLIEGIISAFLAYFLAPLFF